MAKNFHVRSNSLPSGSHPSSVRVVEELTKLRTWESTCTPSSESIGTGLSLLEGLYICLSDFLNAASTQKVISHHQGEKCVEELLDGSVRVLDTCGITRDTIVQIKENVQALHSALRRRKEDSSIEKSVAEYNLFSKKMKKNVKKLVTSLKNLETKFATSPLLNQDQDLAAVTTVLRGVIVMNMSIFRSLLSFLAGPTSKSKATQWLLVTKLMRKGAITCEDNSGNFNELQFVDAALNTLLSLGINVEKMQAAQESLKAVENAIDGLENCLESVFRHLLKTRTSLLNIISH